MRHFASLGILIVVSVPLFGVNFASDKIILHEDGVPVADSAVLYSSEAGSRLALCANGELWLKQRPSPGNLTFFRLALPVTEESKWLNGNDGRGADDYQAYLKTAADAASYTVVIDLPEATDSSVSGGREGMTGGTIGVSRTFIVDLRKGAAQLQAAANTAISAAESEESETTEVPAPAAGGDIENASQLPQILAMTVAALLVLAVALMIIRKFIRA